LSPRYVNRRQSQPPLGCSVQERRKQRAKISQYVFALLPHRDANHLSIITVTTTSHRPYRPVLQATYPSDHTATASHAIAVFLFALAFDCSSFPWNIVQRLLFPVFSSKTGRPSGRFYRFGSMGESPTPPHTHTTFVFLLSLSIGDLDGISVLGTYYWPTAKMACLLHSPPHPHPTLSFAGNMLACHTDNFDRS
jgi:hypothetical protein